MNKYYYMFWGFIFAVFVVMLFDIRSRLATLEDVSLMIDDKMADQSMSQDELPQGVVVIEKDEDSELNKWMRASNSVCQIYKPNSKEHHECMVGLQQTRKICKAFLGREVVIADFSHCFQLALSISEKDKL